LDEVKVTKPHVRVVRNADRTYNFQDLVDEALAQPKSEGPPQKFAVFNIQLFDGRIDFDDRAQKEKHEIADLRIGIPFISSLPAHVEVKVAPELAAKVNGAPLGEGRDPAFHEPASRPEWTSRLRPHRRRIPALQAARQVKSAARRISRRSSSWRQVAAGQGAWRTA
jgi:hypothetical protein